MRSTPDPAARDGHAPRHTAARRLAVLATVLVAAVIATGPAQGASAAGTTAAGGFVGITPARLFTTADPASGPCVLGQRDLSVAGRAGIPADATAAVLTITVITPPASGNLVVWPAGTARPSTAAVNFIGGQTVANTVHVPLGAGGAVSFNVVGGCARLVIDAEGGFAAGTPTGPGGFTPLPRPKVFDSRVTGSGPCVGPARTVAVGGVAGVPAEAAAVALDVTSVRPSAAGGVTVVPAGTTSTATVLNYTGNDVRNASVVMKLGTAGAVSVRASGGCPDVVLSVAGWFRAGPGVADGGFVPLAPVRFLNTRAAGQGPCVNGTRLLTVAGRGGVPAGATAVALNLTAIGASATGFLTVHPATAARPPTSALSYVPTRPVANTYMAALDPTGTLAVYGSTGCPDVVVEVAGYVTGTSTPAPASGPVVDSFTASRSTVAAPGLVALAWTVSDPNGDPLTCSLDLDGNGTTDETVTNCEQGGSRLAPMPAVGTVVPRLTVTDGGPAPATATTSVAVTSGPSETFDITMRNLTPLSPTVQAAFDAAALRWETVLARGIPSHTFSIPAAACALPTEPGFSGTVDDLAIDVEVHPLDGVGGTLASAGPCSPVYGDALPRFGIMEFDSADMASLESDGTLTAVVTHEMAHVLGLGTWWETGRSLRTGAGTASSRFTGALAKAAWSALGRSGDVPLETAYGAGTDDSHWPEATFDNELMTGIISGVRPGNPLSALSIASLADMGYQVDLTAADAFTLPGASVRAAARSAARSADRAAPFDRPRLRQP